MANVELAVNLYKTQNNANPQLNGGIGAGDTAITLKSGDEDKVPTIYTGAASTGGDSRNLTDTGDMAGLSVGDYIENVTDGSWAVITDVTGLPNSVKTTPLRGGNDNQWQSSDTWAVNRFVATLVNLDSDNNITKSERVLATVHAASSASVTVTRGFDSDTALSFAADDYLMLFVLEEHLEEARKAIAQSLIAMDEMLRGQHSYAADSGAADAYVVALDPDVTAYADIEGMPIFFKPGNANTGASTLNINGLGAKDIKKRDGTSDLAANDIQADNMFVGVIYNSTTDDFVMVTNLGNAPVAGDFVVSDKTSDSTLTSDNSGQLVTNSGASGAVKLTLPSASAGLNIRHLVVAEHFLTIAANSGDEIKISPKTGGKGAANQRVSSRSVGAHIHLACHDATTWYVIENTGDWAGIGYDLGGYDGTNMNEIQKYAFDSQVASELTATLTVAGYQMGGVSGPKKGYAMGGDVSSSYDTDIEDLDFNDETNTLLGATMDQGVQTKHQTCESDTKGYTLGGRVTGHGATNQIEDMNFSSEASAALGATLATAEYHGGGVSGLTVGYIAGGANSGTSNNVEGFTYSSEAVKSVTDNLDAAAGSTQGCESDDKGFFFSGAQIEGIVFSSEAVADVGDGLTGSKTDPCPVSGAYAGALLGGNDAGSDNQIDEYNYTEEAVHAVTDTMVSAFQYGGAGVHTV